MPVRSKLQGLDFGRWNVQSYAGLVGKNAYAARQEAEMKYFGYLKQGRE